MDEIGKENSEPPPSACCNCGGAAAAAAPPKEPDNLLTLLDLDLGENNFAPIMFDDDDKGTQAKRPAAKAAKRAIPANPRLSLVQRRSLSLATAGSVPAVTAAAAGRRPLGAANNQQRQPPTPAAAGAPAAAKAPVSLKNRRSLLPPAKKQTSAATPLPGTPASRPVAAPNRQSIAGWWYRSIKLVAIDRVGFLPCFIILV